MKELIEKIKVFFAERKFLAISLIIILIGAVYILFFYEVRENQALPTLSNIIKTESKTSESARTDISAFGLNIEKIGVWVPVISGVDDSSEEEYLKAIENGVALSKFYAKTPTETGNMFIFGHSRYYKNKPGNYKEVFKDLNQMSQGDRFTLYYNKQAYSYEVTDSKKVNADEISIKNPNPGQDSKSLTLMTCWPPGTTTYRWAVFAKQI